ncbi:MAG: DNA-3-methyladenine glycosylase [Thermoleophilia bacterium]
MNAFERRSGDLEECVDDLATLPSSVRALPPSFFARPADQVAADLVGKIFWREGVGGGRLVEVEAYLAEGDPACHAARGKTRRNASLFGPPGYLYVYIGYGIHHLLNVSTEREGRGTGVLLRALEPLLGVEVLRRNRGGGGDGPPDRLLASGPGRLAQALGVDMSHNGLPLGPESGFWICDDGTVPPVEQTPRIGVGGGEDLSLRYILPGSRFLSRAPRHGRPVGRGSDQIELREAAE